MAEKRGFFEDYEGNVLKVRDEDALPLSGGTLTGPVVGADGALDTAQLRNIQFGTEALVPGQSPLAPGTLYITPEGELDEIPPQELLDKLKTVDGEGSGLDADTLDGRQSSDFALKTDIPDLSEYMKESEFVGTGATKSVNNANKLGGTVASDYVKGTDIYGPTARNTVYKATGLAYNWNDNTSPLNGGALIKNTRTGGTLSPPSTYCSMIYLCSQSEYNALPTTIKNSPDILIFVKE